jgi:hypothetical protein
MGDEVGVNLGYKAVMETGIAPPLQIFGKAGSEVVFRQPI